MVPVVPVVPVSSGGVFARFRKTALVMAMAVVVATASRGFAQAEDRVDVPSGGTSGAEVLQAVVKDGKLVAGKGWLEVVDGLKVAHFKGTPEEIGSQHAALLVKTNLDEMLGVFNRLDPSKNGKTWGEKAVAAVKNLYAKAKFVPAFKRHIPKEYLDELRGFVVTASNGANQNIDDLVMANAFQDLALAFGCSSFAASGPATVDGSMYVGRNLDDVNMLDLAKYQVVAFYEPEKGYPFVTLTPPAFVGVMHGMNANGLVVAMNYSVASSGELTIDGIPFTLLLRQVLQYASGLDQAVDMIKRAPRTVGLSVMVADGKANRAAIIEIAANRFVVREAKDGIVYAANRYESPFMKAVQGGGWLSSWLRVRRFDEIFAEKRGQIDLKAAVGIVRDKFGEGTAAHNGFISPAIDNEGTMASFVFEPTRRRVWIARVGADRPAPDNEFIGFDLDKEFGRDGGDAGGREEAYERERIPATAETPFFQDWLAVGKARIADRTGRAREIPDLLTPVVERRPDAEEALLLLGKGDLMSGRTDDGVRLLEKVTSLPEVTEPHNLLEAHYWLGLIADLRGQREEAISHYKAAQRVRLEDSGGDGDVFTRMTASGLLGPLRKNSSGRIEASVPAVSPSAKNAAATTDLARRLEGKTISRIIVLGAAKTRESVILAQLPFRVGEAYSAQKAALARTRLGDLDIFDDRLHTIDVVAVPGSQPDGVEVVVRVAESELLFKEPIEFVATTGMNLMGSRVEQTLRNVGGSGVSLSGSYSWGKNWSWSLGSSIPATADLGSLRLAGITRVGVFRGWTSRRFVGGQYDGEAIRGLANTAEAGLTWYPAYGWRLAGGIGYHETLFSSGASGVLRAERQDYLLASGGVRWNRCISGSASGSSSGSFDTGSVALELKARAARALDGRNPNFGSLEGQVNGSVGVKSVGMLLGRLSAGAMSNPSPANYWFGVGGFSALPLRGHGAPLYGTGYLSSTVELQRPLGNGVTLAVFADSAQVWQGEARLRPRAPVGVGAGLGYQPPMGPAVRLDLATDPFGKTFGWKIAVGGSF